MLSEVDIVLIHITKSWFIEYNCPVGTSCCKLGTHSVRGVPGLVPTNGLHLFSWTSCPAYYLSTMKVSQIWIPPRNTHPLFNGLCFALSVRMSEELAVKRIKDEINWSSDTGLG